MLFTKMHSQSKMCFPTIPNIDCIERKIFHLPSCLFNIYLLDQITPKILYYRICLCVSVCVLNRFPNHAYNDHETLCRLLNGSRVRSETEFQFQKTFWKVLLGQNHPWITAPINASAFIVSLFWKLNNATMQVICQYRKSLI